MVQSWFQTGVLLSSSSGPKLYPQLLVLSQSVLKNARSRASPSWCSLANASSSASKALFSFYNFLHEDLKFLLVPKSERSFQLLDSLPSLATSELYFIATCHPRDSCWVRTPDDFSALRTLSSFYRTMNDLSLVGLREIVVTSQMLDRPSRFRCTICDIASQVIVAISSRQSRPPHFAWQCFPLGRPQSRFRLLRDS